MTYDEDNRLIRAHDSLSKADGGTGDRALGHDNRGNVNLMGDQRFSYSAMDRPEVLYGDVEAVYRYDGHGRRVRSVIWKDVGYITRYNIYGLSVTRYNIYGLSEDGREVARPH